MIVVFTTPPESLSYSWDQRHVVAAEPVELARDDGRRFRIPIGAKSDLASTPRFMWMTLPPFGTYARSARVHDAAYQGSLETSRTGNGSRRCSARPTATNCSWPAWWPMG